jgi:Ran GTPase-activating protein (RanGAP) involved in mRNA processing and transport
MANVAKKDAVKEVKEETKIVDADTEAFITTSLKNSLQKVYYRGWVTLTQADDKDKSRVLVITQFRVMTIRIGVLGRKIEDSCPILGMQHLSVEPNDTSVIKIVFDVTQGITLNFSTNKTRDVIHTLLFMYDSISLGRSPLTKILPKGLLDGYLAPEPDAQDGLIALYLAECDRVDTLPRLPVLDYLMTSFQLNTRLLDLRRCLLPKDQDAYTKDCIALFNAVTQSEWFNEVVVEEIPIKAPGVEAVAKILLSSQKSKITKLTITDNKAARKGVESLAKALASGLHTLDHLNYSMNEVPDAGVVALCDGLTKGPVLSALTLAGDQLTPKGVKVITTFLSTEKWLTGLKFLDLSDNKFGKTGSASVASWLGTAAARGLQGLYLVSCDLDVDVIIQALLKLQSTTLSTLNLNDNKFNKHSAASLLAKLVLQTNSLGAILLSNTALTTTGFADIVTAGFYNKENVQFSMDFSNNDLGPKAIKELNKAWQTKKSKDPKFLMHTHLHRLVMSNNNLGQEGIIELCEMLEGSDLHSLVIDANVKVKVFGNNRDVGDALAVFVNKSPKLRLLSIAGDNNNYLKADLAPLFPAIQATKTLQKLNVSRNRLENQGVSLLAQALLVNTSLVELDCDGNQFKFPGFRDLAKAAIQHKTLQRLQFEGDIRSMIEKEARYGHDVRLALAQIDANMDANAFKASGEQKAAQEITQFATVAEFDKQSRVRTQTTIDRAVLFSNSRASQAGESDHDGQPTGQSVRVGLSTRSSPSTRKIDDAK